MCVGVSAGVPLRQGGVIGFDFTLNTLSRLIGDYRITPNSIIMVASETGAVFMESEACQLEHAGCLPGEDEVRAAMRSAIAQAVAGGQARRARRRARRARLPACWCMQHAADAGTALSWSPPPCRSSSCPPISQTLVQRRRHCRGGRRQVWPSSARCSPRCCCRAPMSRIAGKTERIRNLDFSDRMPVESRITEIVRLSDPVERMREGLEVFGRYVSKNLGAPDHALARDRRRRRRAARDHGDVHRHRGLLAASARPWSRSS